MCQFSGETDNFDVFGTNLPKIGFRVGDSENYCQSKNRHSRDSMLDNFQAKRTTLTFLGQNLPKNEFWGWNFKNLSPDPESPLPIYHVSQFSAKTNNLNFLA